MSCGPLPCLQGEHLQPCEPHLRNLGGRALGQGDLVAAHRHHHHLHLVTLRQGAGALHAALLALVQQAGEALGNLRSSDQRRVSWRGTPA
jgi:hypothetical protein